MIYMGVSSVDGQVIITEKVTISAQAKVVIDRKSRILENSDVKPSAKITPVWTGIMTDMDRPACQRVKWLPACLSSTNPCDLRNRIRSCAVTCGILRIKAPRRSVLRHAPVSHFEVWVGDEPGEIEDAAESLREYFAWPPLWFFHC
jgi:hypothetical protein